MNTADKKIIPGLAILAVIVLFFTVRTIWLQDHLPGDLEQQAKAFTYLDIIEKPAVANHAGTAIGLIHTTDYGEGVFIEDIRNRNEQKLCEVKDADYDPHSAWLFGWSPDDAVFAFSWNRVLQFVKGDTGEPLGSVNADSIQSFTWLSPTLCAYMSNAGELIFIGRGGEGWKEINVRYLSATNGVPEQLLATGVNSVAWRVKREVWQMDLSSGQSKLLFTVPGTGIRDLAYSKETGTFLVVDLRGSAFKSLMSVSSQGGMSTAAILQCKHPGIRGVQWINHGKGYAYIDNNLGANGTEPLIVKANEDAPERTYLPHGQALYTFCDDSKVYMAGDATNEAFGVWRCDADRGEVTRVWSPGNTGAELHYQPLLTGHADMGNHHVEDFYLIPPAHFSRRKKYPLVIGFSGYEWSPVSQGAATGQVLANCGSYYAYVPYRWPAGRQRDESVYWEAAAPLRAAYDQLLTNPHIDKNQVFLFGFSENTAMVKLLADRFPGRWKGVIDLSAVGVFPTAKAGEVNHLIAFSTASGIEPDFRQYQLEMFKIGIPMDWHIYEGAHLPRSKAVLFHESTQIAGMIFGK